MAYTVKKLAQLSGVSIRTLHFYDEIDLLKPAYYGENNYRYYEEEQLLMLQQILFYRELDLPLNEIQKILASDEFDKIKALKSHKIILEANLDRTSRLIETIDKTIKHLRGEKMVKLDEIFKGFSEEKQKIYENFLIEQGVNPSVIKEVNSKIKNWTKDEWLANKKEADEIYAKLAESIDQGLSPESPQVQALIDAHYKMTTKFWIPNKESFIGLSEFYKSHPDFEKYYDAIHPQLLEFLSAAMKIYAEEKLRDLVC